MSALAVLRRPGVARLGGAGLLSEVGDWMLFIALPLFVLQLSGSPLVTATVFALELVPSVVAAPFVGMLIDRVDPWRLMAAVATLQALCLLPLLAVHTAADLWVVYVVVAVEAVLGTVIEPCRAVTAAGLVATEQLMPLNQGLAVLSNLARLVGGPLGGLALGVGGVGAVVLADAAGFLAAAAVLGLHRTHRSVTAHMSQHVCGDQEVCAVRPGGDWADGLRAIARSPVLRRVVGIGGFLGFAQGAFVVLFVLFVVRDLHGSEVDVGVLRGVQAIGAVAGGVVLTVLVRRCRPERLVVVSLVAFGVLSLAIWNAPAVSGAFGLYVALFVAVGVPGLLATTGVLTLLQTHSGEDVRGRVLTSYFAVYGGVQAVGMLAAGLVGTGAGLTIALQVQGALFLAAAALALRLRTEMPSGQIAPASR